ncbi:MAG TPA: hypothetical protein VL993_06065 [Stellaceae bacterium]|nr:hypothetical protein [Stellaceae bacterium]
MQRLERRRRDRRNATSLVLDPYRRNVTSQNGEDGIIARIFDVIGTTNRWCVEFGAWDGKLHSNTWTLIRDQGWTGVLIEGEADRFADLEKAYADCGARTHLMRRFVGLDPGNRLDDLLSQVSTPEECDLISIDIDGNDWHIWNSLTTFHPRVVVIECNPSIENDIYFVQHYGPLVHHGASMLALVELGRSKGYELVASTGVNGFFVRTDLFAAFGISDNSIDALHDTRDLQIQLFQGYDGTLFAAGDLKLHWHGRALTQEDFQVLRPIDRRFPGTRRRRWWRSFGG